MRLSRRMFCAGLSASALAGCGGAPTLRGMAATTPDPGLIPQRNPGFDAWVAAFRPRAAAEGITDATYDRAFRGAGFLPGVIERDRNQTEFKRSLEDYMAIAASDQRVEMGREALRRHVGALTAIESRFGVEGRILTAFWGLESFYGTRMGDIPVISAVTTLAFDGRRAAFFERQLLDALKIAQAGDIAPERMTGSWAGAMGHTQFMPSSYLAYAVDFTGDGRRDIWSDDPSDSLASTANYVSRFGWQTGRPWGMEVRLPAGFDAGLAGRANKRAATDWAARGVRDMAGRPVPDHGPSAILIPAGLSGPAFIVYRNFDVIMRYNASEHYALGVGHLSDRITGGAPIQGRFPPDANGMTIDDRKRLQQRLSARGFDTGGVDGVIGNNTRAAISAYQQSIGLPVTGEPSLALMRSLG